jgi:hypothetical protein
MGEKVEWVCGKCSLGPCYGYLREKPVVCTKLYYSPNFKKSIG